MRTMMMTVTGLLATAAMLAAGCDPWKDVAPDAGMIPSATPDAGEADAGVTPADDAALDSGVETGAVEAGTDGDTDVHVVVGPPALAAPPPVGFVVVGSDYMSTSISLLDTAGALAKDDCINSGTHAAGQLSLTLTGDVTVPSQPQRGNELWLIDRSNAALTVLDAATCVVRRQFAVGTGFRANPHDVVTLSDHKAYVTRYERNALAQTPTAAGDDLLIVDPQSGAITGRIDLGPYAAKVAGAQLQARPDRAVIVAGKVVVTLGSLDATFATSGEGRVVIVDPATDKVTAVVSLTGLKSCSGMDVLPGTSTVYVACSGSFGDVDQALESGVALVDVAASPPAVTRVISSVLFEAHPMNFSWVVAASPSLVFGATLGSFPDAASHTAGTADAVFAFDPQSGHRVQLGVGGAYDLGRAAGDAAHLVVPDAAAAKPRLHVFDVSVGVDPQEAAAFDPNPSHHLPPREVAWF